MIKTIFLSKRLLLQSGVEVDVEGSAFKILVPCDPEAVVGVVLDELDEGLVPVFAEGDNFVAEDLGVVGWGWLDGFDKFKPAGVGDDPSTEECGEVGITVDETGLEFILAERLVLGECLLVRLALEMPPCDDERGTILLLATLVAEVGSRSRNGVCLTAIAERQ
jgi:hypothetical protein